MRDLIDRTATAIAANMPVEDIHDMLIGERLTEYEAFLTYVAGRMIAEARFEARTRPTRKF